MSTTQAITDPLASLIAADVQRAGAALVPGSAEPVTSEEAVAFAQSAARELAAAVRR